MLNPEHNSLQHSLDEFAAFCDENLFRVNGSKSSAMAINFSHSYDFSPKFHLGNEILQVVETSKILGLQINNRLRWDSHVEYICNKARQRIWALRRLLQLNLDHETIIDFFLKEVRTILEYGAVVFHSGLTRQQSNSIESIQRGFFKMVTQSLQLKLSYSEACIFFCCDKLEFRRLDLCKTFLKRNIDNPLHSNMFKKTIPSYNTRSGIKLSQYQTRTKRFAQSPLVFLTKLGENML